MIEEDIECEEAGVKADVPGAVPQSVRPDLHPLDREQLAMGGSASYGMGPTPTTTAAAATTTLSKKTVAAPMTTYDDAVGTLMSPLSSQPTASSITRPSLPEDRYRKHPHKKEAKERGDAMYSASDTDHEEEEPETALVGKEPPIPTIVAERTAKANVGCACTIM